MTAANLDFVMVDNEDFLSPHISIQNPDGTPFSLNSMTIRMQVRATQGEDGSPLLELAPGAGITVISSPGGVIQIDVARFALQKGDYWQDLVGERDGFRTAIFAGRFFVSNGVTRWP